MHDNKQRPIRQYLRVVERDAALDGYMIQGSTQPILDCEGDLGLEWVCGSCRKCVLVVNADPEILFGVRIQCNQCMAVNETPFSEGESLPAGGFCFNKGKTYRFDSTVYPKGVPIMSQSFVDLCNIYTHSSVHSMDIVVPFTLFETVNRLAARTGPRFEKICQSIKRAPYNSRDRIHPMLAAQMRAEDSMNVQATIYSQDADELIVFHEFYSRWENHPRSKVIVDGLLNEYDHTMVMLFTASYLATNGFGITFSSSILHGRATTDLYARLALDEIIHFEVKVPNSRAAVGSSGEISKTVQSAWKKVRSKRQITRSSSGFIVIGRIALSEPWHEELNDEIDSLLRLRGRGNKHVEGVLAVELPVRDLLVPNGKGGVGLREIPSPRFHSNPFFVGRRRVAFQENLGGIHSR